MYLTNFLLRLGMSLVVESLRVVVFIDVSKSTRMTTARLFAVFGRKADGPLPSLPGSTLTRHRLVPTASAAVVIR